MIIILTQIKEEYLILNSQISKYSREQRAKEKNKQDKLLTKLEQIFRNFIKAKLEDVALDWWITHIPADIRKKLSMQKYGIKIL